MKIQSYREVESWSHQEIMLIHLDFIWEKSEVLPYFTDRTSSRCVVCLSIKSKFNASSRKTEIEECLQESLPVAMIKHPNKSNLRGKGFIVAHSQVHYG